MALEENTYNHLEELGGSNYEIVDGEPNIKGWDVKNASGQIIGEVDELLFDPQSRNVRYLVVDLDGNKLGVENDKKVLIPIGIAQLYDDEVEQESGTNVHADPDMETGVYNPYTDGEVVVAPVTAEQLSTLPPYEKGKVTPAVELSVRQILQGLVPAGLAAGAGTAAYSKEEFYTHDHFNEDRFYDRKKFPIIEENLIVGKQEVETDSTRTTSRIVERPVQEKIILQEEHVNVERTPVDRPLDQTDPNAFKEEEFELTEHAEVPVITKEARIVEEVTLNKEVEEKDEMIQDTLRNTEVKTERIPAENNDKGRFPNTETGIL